MLRLPREPTRQSISRHFLNISKHFTSNLGFENISRKTGVLFASWPSEGNSIYINHFLAVWIVREPPKDLYTGRTKEMKFLFIYLFIYFLIFPYLSASSRTRYVTRLISIFLISIKSMRRPGVATTISQPRSKSRICGPFGAPPYTQVLREVKKVILYLVKLFTGFKWFGACLAN